MSDQSGPTNPSQIASAVFNGMRIQATRNPVVSKRKGNQIIRAVNALLHWKVGVTDGQVPSIALADNGVVLLVPKGGGASGTPVAINWLGEYSGSADYAVNDLVHVTDGMGVSFYLCLGVNGPGSAVHAPSSGATTTWWECYSSGGGGGLTSYRLISSGFDMGDYLIGKKCVASGDFDSADLTEYNIAKPTLLRDSKLPVDTVVWPPYHAGDIIFGAKSGHTQVAVEGEEVEAEIIDVNADGRAIMREFRWLDMNDCLEHKAWVAMSANVLSTAAMPS